MANDGFNGTTITFGSSATPLLSCRAGSSAAQVKVSGSGDSSKLYVAGIPDDTFECTIVGVTTITAGATAATLTIAWFDGSTDTLTTAVPVDVDTSGSEDEAITSTITFKRAS